MGVSDLKNYPYGTTHREAKAVISGILGVANSESSDYPRGTVLLVDTMTNDPIPCLVNRLRANVVNTPVIVKKWNLVNLQEGANSCHLEFRLEDVYRETSSKKSVLKEDLSGDWFLFNQTVKRKASYYIPGDHISLRENVYMAGIVHAISTLYVQPDKPAMFFVQMTSSTELKAINILFQGDGLIDYYRHFQIGGAYAFQNLCVETINSTDRNSFCVLTFGHKRSKCQSITYTQLQDICRMPASSSISSSSSSNISSAEQPTLVDVHKHKTYTGTITRVIDSMFGIYELDRKIIVSLFHLFSYSADMPFRIDTRVRLHHFHAVIVNPEDDETSYLFQHVWQVDKSDEGYLALAACFQSHVEILKFPKNHNVFEETTSQFFLAHNTDISAQIKLYVFTDIIRRKSTFQQLLRQLEVYAALTVKFIDTHIVADFSVFQRAYRTVRDQVFATTRTRVMQAGDMMNDFVLHDTVCVLVGEENLRVVIDAYPSLDRVKAKLECKLEDNHLDLAGGNTMFEKENVLTQRADYDQTAEYCILGMLQVSRDGRLYLMDNASRILFVLASSSSEIPAKIGEIYLVRRLQLFAEDLSFVENEDEEFIKRKDLRLTYAVCQASDLLLLDNDEDDGHKDTTFCLLEHQDLETKKLDKLSLCHVSENNHNLPRQHQYLAVHVVNRFPVEACFTANGSVYLECRVVVKMYEIEGLGSSRSSPGFIETNGSTDFVLVFSSLKNSLHLHFDFQVGSYWIIYGLDRPESFIKAPRFALTIDTDKHTVYPLSSPAANSNAIQLLPHYSQDMVPKDPQSLIYTVSQVADIEHLPAGLTAATIPQHYFEQLVHVQGVVIIKRFMEGYSAHGTLNKHAFKLYNQLGVSTGKTNRKLFIQLRQPDSLDVISIYMDVHKIHYPVGMVIGATVTFRNLIRKKKAFSEESFFLADSTACIQVNNTTPSPNVVSMEPARVKTRLISSFLNTDIGLQDLTDRQIFRLFCYIHAIINLTLKWECRDCGSIVRNKDCYGMCQGASRVFSAHALVQISDGTANANAGIDGERLVFRLLQLSSNQIDALKNLVLDYGQLTYGGWGAGKVTTMDDEEERMSYDPEKEQRNAMHGYTLEDLCNNAKRAGQFYLYGQVEQKTSRKRARDEEEGYEFCTDDLVEQFQLRKFKISDNGSLLKTAELSKLRVKVVEITFPDAKAAAYEMLDALNQT